jgi:predicted nucleotidyltransferase
MIAMAGLRSSDGLMRRVGEFFEKVAPTDVVSAYVFGSHAEGRAHRDSDLDVGVVMDRSVRPTRRDRFEASIRLSASLQARLGDSNLDLLVLDDAPPAFARRVVYEGRRVYCRDPEADHAFVRDVQLRAADLEPFLARMRAINMEALSPG